MVWLAVWAGGPVIISLLASVFLLFPDGRLALTSSFRRAKGTGVVERTCTSTLRRPSARPAWFGCAFAYPGSED